MFNAVRKSELYCNKFINHIQLKTISKKLKSRIVVIEKFGCYKMAQFESIQFLFK